MPTRLPTALRRSADASVAHPAPHDSKLVAQPRRGSYGSVHSASRRRARRVSSCDSTRAVSDLDLATWPPRSEDRRRFASGGFGPLGYPVDAALRFPSALHVPARRRHSTSAATSIVGTIPKRKLRPRLPLPRGRATEPSFAVRRTTECRGAAGHRALEVHGCPCSARECEPRPNVTLRRRLGHARRSSCDDRRAHAGRRPRTEESDATSDRAPARRFRRTPFVVGDVGIVGWKSTRPVTPSTEARHERGPREGPRL